MMLRCCASLWIELDRQPRFSLRALCEGGDGFDRVPRWRALAAHLDAPVAVDDADLSLLQRIASDEPFDGASLDEAESIRAQALLAAGLLLNETDSGTTGARDSSIRDSVWWGPAALAHLHGRWHDNDISSRWAREGALSSAQMVEAFGPAPEAHQRRTRERQLPLPLPQQGVFDALLGRRLTCRNFDPQATLDQPTLATMLFRMIGTLGTQTFAPGAVAVKKHAPGGGGLHVTEAYVLARRVDGLPVGLYHYCSDTHALECLRTLDEAEARALAYRCLAGQDWFVDAPLLVLLTSRFDRLFWKYRRHTKAWKVAQLDAGHISMLMYLSAADLGLGAFVTAAINDRVVEEALDLDPVVEGATAVVGFGARDAAGTTRELTELDPSPVMRRLRATLHPADRDGDGDRDEPPVAASPDAT